VFDNSGDPQTFRCVKGVSAGRVRLAVLERSSSGSRTSEADDRMRVGLWYFAGACLLDQPVKGCWPMKWGVLPGLLV
jgi:hypothetical protein